MFAKIPSSFFRKVGGCGVENCLVWKNFKKTDQRNKSYPWQVPLTIWFAYGCEQILFNQNVDQTKMTWHYYHFFKRFVIPTIEVMSCLATKQFLLSLTRLKYEMWKFSVWTILILTVLYHLNCIIMILITH